METADVEARPAVQINTNRMPILVSEANPVLAKCYSCKQVGTTRIVKKRGK